MPFSSVDAIIDPRPTGRAAKRRAQGRRRPGSRGLVAGALAIALLVLLQAGCGSMWSRLRESERLMALETGRTQTGRGQCAPGLASIDRAQARLDLGLYAREATVARARCYDKLGQSEIAAAHRRLVDDFYTEEPMALPEPDGSSIFRVSSLEDGPYQRPPGWLEIPRPRYSPYAQRSKIVGRVVVAFDLAGNNRPKRIRVLEMPHPLLATWAIEAVAAATPSKKRTPENVLRDGRYVTTFVFEWRWAEPEQVDDYES